MLDEGAGYKVKRIEVIPGNRLSCQKHARRDEHWMIAAGTAKVTLDGREIIVNEGEKIDISAGAAHRIDNPGNVKLVFIEIQRGRLSRRG